MAILPIVTYDDPVLRKETKPVTENDRNLQQLIDDMFETMYNSDGIGLAAPQVGELKRVFVMDADPIMEEGETLYGPMAFINPEIVETGQEEVTMDEGCLSIPELTDKVTRPENIRVTYKNRKFEDQELQAGGWIARIIQHETDHLHGILFIDYLSSFRKRMHKAELKKIASGQKETKYPVRPKE